ncbi:MAG: serine proteinase [Clostridiales bacterium]|nr:serine proteinase [Clostridiales bacterium]
MAFIDDLKKRANGLAQQASDLAQTGAAKSRQLAAIAKLKAANLGEEDTIRKAYAELGKQYFAKYGENPEDEFVAACATILEAQAAIAANNALIEEMSAKPEAEEVPVDEEAPAEEEAVEEEAPADEEAAPAEEAPAEDEAAPAEEAPAEDEAAPAEEEPKEE